MSADISSSKMRSFSAAFSFDASRAFSTICSSSSLMRASFAAVAPSSISTRALVEGRCCKLLPSERCWWPPLEAQSDGPWGCSHEFHGDVQRVQQTVQPRLVETQMINGCRVAESHE